MMLPFIPDNLKRSVRRVHFVGVGGAGMSGIAEVLHNLGFLVTGSDLRENDATNHLRSIGMEVHSGHDENRVNDVDAVVVSSAVDDSNVELREAQERSIPIVPRAEMLSELMRFRFGIAIAGTHGKTTTTSMVANLLTLGGLEPTYIIGGKVKSFDSNAKLGTGQYLIAEADESDGSFLYLQPVIAVITNIDQDHLGNYENDVNKLENAFMEFIHHVPFYGLIVACIDDPVLYQFLPRISRPVLTYGFHEEANVKASHVVQDEEKTRFKVEMDGTSREIEMHAGGSHNVQNALAAIAVAHEVGMSATDIALHMRNFQGIQRRFDLIGTYSIDDKSDILVIDDYAHHPREISSILEGVRHGWKKRRVVVVFQPHRYSRTRDLFDDFVDELSNADVLVVTKTYSAGEKEIPNFDARSLCAAIRQRGKLSPVYIDEVGCVVSEIPYLLTSNDVLLLLGAGDISQVSEAIKSGWRAC